MIIKSVVGQLIQVPDNPRLQRAIAVGAVRIDSIEEGGMRATILAPQNLANFTDEDILLILQAATEIGSALENLGFTVTY